MVYVPGQPLHQPALGRVAILSTETMARESSRMLTHAVVISAPMDGYRPSTLEVANALSHQLHVPRINFHVTRHKSDAFITAFNLAPERDRAFYKGFVEIEGATLPIRPWRMARGTTETTWWFHVKVTVENVPLEAWNEDGVKLILATCAFSTGSRDQPCSGSLLSFSPAGPGWRIQRTSRGRWSTPFSW